MYACDVVMEQNVVVAHPAQQLSETLQDLGMTEFEVDTYSSDYDDTLMSLVLG